MNSGGRTWDEFEDEEEAGVMQMQCPYMKFSKNLQKKIKKNSYTPNDNNNNNNFQIQNEVI